jgi:Holliday junction DNA helicase RuvA
MIGSLRGTVLDRTPRGEVLVEVAGVGYRVTVPATALGPLSSVGAEVFLHVHHHIREDQQTLYGFLQRSERDCFEALLGAHGVGPALALAILSVHGPRELSRVLVEEDVAALCLVPGVGRKTAARLLVELKARLDIGSLEVVGAGASGGGANANGSGFNGHHAGGNGHGSTTFVTSPRAVVRQALAELGYGPDEVRVALDGLEGPDGEGPAAESELLRAALQRLAPGR